MSAPLLVWTFFAYFLIAESPRWLLVNKGTAAADAVRAAQGRLSALPFVFFYESPCCTGLLYGRAGRLTAENGGSRRGQCLAKVAAKNGTTDKLATFVLRRPGTDGGAAGDTAEVEAKGPKDGYKVRQTPRWPRSWFNCRRL